MITDGLSMGETMLGPQAGQAILGTGFRSWAVWFCELQAGDPLNLTLFLQLQGRPN